MSGSEYESDVFPLKIYLDRVRASVESFHHT